MTESEARASIRTPGHYAMRPLDQFVVTHSAPESEIVTDPTNIVRQMVRDALAAFEAEQPNTFRLILRCATTFSDSGQAQSSPLIE